MPAKDYYHDQAKNALANDDWKITHDQLRLRWRATDTYVDLGAEKLLGAERNNQKIAVEIKSFIGRSMVSELEDAIGQYTLYEELLQRLEPDRVLYLAVPLDAYLNVFVDAIGEVFLESKRVRLLVFDPDQEVILQWVE